MRPIDVVYDKITAAQKEIEEIRAKCTHPKYKVGWYSWRIGAMDPKRLCVDCDQILEGVTEEEARVLRAELFKNEDGHKYENASESVRLIVP
jgi:hypothetical protein